MADPISPTAELESIFPAQKIQEAVRNAFDTLEDKRADRADLIKTYIDGEYEWNLGADAIDALLPHIVELEPEFVATPKRSGIDVQAVQLSILLASKAEEMDFGTLAEEVIKDALFSPLGIFYTFLRDGDRLFETNGRLYDVGEPATIGIAFEDWCCDPHCNKFRDRKFEAHRFRADRQWLLNSPSYAAHADLINTLPTVEDGRRDREETSAQDETEKPRNGDSVGDTVELYNVVMYIGNDIYEGVIPAGNGVPAKWLTGGRWVGCRGGPYRHVFFDSVPSNVMPKIPAKKLFRAADLVNRSIKKISDGIDGSKKFGVYKKGAKGDGNKVKEALHGDMIGLQDPSAVAAMDFSLDMNHLTPGLQLLLALWEDLSLSRLMNGSGINSDRAAGQEILASAAMRRLERLKSRVRKVMQEVAEQWAHYLVSDPMGARPMMLDVPGIGQIETEFNPEGMQPDDLKLKVAVRSMQSDDPMVQSKITLEALNTLGGLAQMAQMGLCDLNAVASMLQRGTNNRELALCFPSPQLQATQAQAEMMADAAMAPGEAQRPGNKMPSTMNGLRQSTRASARIG